MLSLGQETTSEQEANLQLITMQPGYLSYDIQQRTTNPGLDAVKVCLYTGHQVT